MRTAYRLKTRILRTKGGRGHPHYDESSRLIKSLSKLLVVDLPEKMFDDYSLVNCVESTNKSKVLSLCVLTYKNSDNKPCATHMFKTVCKC